MLEKIKNNLQLVIPLLTLLILSGILALLLNNRYNLNHTRYRYIADNQANHIISCVDKIVVRSEVLKESVIGQNGQTTAFNRIAPQVYRDIKADTNVSLRNIALAPGCVISEVFPLGSNEILPGFNYADTRKIGNLEAIEAWRRNRIILTNPYYLIQGGKGISVRVPVFMKANQPESLWGLVSLTIDVDELINSFKFRTLTDMGINYELWYNDDKGYRISLAASNKLPEEPVSLPFMVRNLSWTLDVAPAGGWIRTDNIIVGLILILVITLLVYRLVHYIQRVEEMDNRISDLKHRDLNTLAYTPYYLDNTLLNPYTGNWAEPKKARWSMSLVRIDRNQLTDDTLPGGKNRILFTISELIARHLHSRHNDLLIRYSENEFLVLWNDIPPDKLRERTKHLQERCRSITFSDQPSLHLNITITSQPYISPELSRYNTMIAALKQSPAADNTEKEQV